jgi:hypothetical protein
MFSRKSISQLEKESANVRKMILNYNNKAKPSNLLPDFVIPKSTNQLKIPPKVDKPVQNTPWKIRTAAFDTLSENEKNNNRKMLRNFLSQKPPDYNDLDKAIITIEKQEKQERDNEIRILEQKIEALKAKQRIKKLQDELEKKLKDELEENPDDISHLLGGKQKDTKPATTKPATKKPATKKPTTKPATTKPATKKPATKKPATKKPATKKPATKKP